MITEAELEAQGERVKQIKRQYLCYICGKEPTAIEYSPEPVQSRDFIPHTVPIGIGFCVRCHRFACDEQHVKRNAYKGYDICIRCSAGVKT
jgi:hypothetical protein